MNTLTVARPAVADVLDLDALGLIPACQLAGKHGQRKPRPPRLPKPQPKHRYRIEVDSFSRGHYAVSSRTYGHHLMHVVHLEMRDIGGQIVQRPSCDCAGHAYRGTCTHYQLAAAWHKALQGAWRRPQSPRPGGEQATAARKHWHADLDEAPGYREYYCPLPEVA